MSHLLFAVVSNPQLAACSLYKLWPTLARAAPASKVSTPTFTIPYIYVKNMNVAILILLRGNLEFRKEKLEKNDYENKANIDSYGVSRP
jgi:hypothetical protein